MLFILVVRFPDFLYVIVMIDHVTSSHCRWLITSPVINIRNEQSEFSTRPPDLVKADNLKGFLGDPRQGGGPEDLRVVVDWEAFVSCHADTFVYDASTKSVRIRVPGHKGFRLIRIVGK